MRTRGRSDTLRAILGFVARFLFLWAAILFTVSRFPRISEWAVGGTIESLRLILGVVGLEATAEGDRLAVGQTTVQIVNDCTPIAPAAGLWAAMLAFPAPALWKVAGLLAGSVALWLYNLARILLLLPVLAYRPHLYAAIHAYLWQTLTLVIVSLLLALWYRWQPPVRDST